VEAVEVAVVVMADLAEKVVPMQTVEVAVAILVVHR
jgi:hypothetical protein